MPTTTLPAQRRAAALLEAVARHCEDAAGLGVPLRCGHAATLLGGAYPSPVPDLPDRIADVRAAITDALKLLAQLPLDTLPQPEHDRIADAAAEARAALAATQR